MSTVHFRIAANTVIPFGPYAMRSIDSIASKDTGLMYLDWLYGAMTGKGPSPYKQPGYDNLREALDTYLSDPTISKELKALLDDKYGLDRMED